MLRSIIKRLRNIPKLPSADVNAHRLKLLFQGLPYIFCRNGYSFKPLSVFFSINSDCTLKCKMCDIGTANTSGMMYQNLAGAKNKEIPLEDIKKIIDELATYKPYISFPSVEPLLYKQLIPLVRYIRGKEMRVGLATNGFFLENVAEELIKADLTKIVVSIDGPATVHDEVRGVKGTHEKVIKGINHLIAMKRKYNRQNPYLYINSVIQEDNYNCLEELVDNLPVEHITLIDFRLMFSCSEELVERHNLEWGHKYRAFPSNVKGKINLANINVNVLVDQINSLKKKYGNKCHFFFNSQPAYLRRFFNSEELLDSNYCLMPWYTAEINQDGTMIGEPRCYPLDMGSVSKEGFFNVWYGSKMREFRKDLQKNKRFPACVRCEALIN